MKNEKAWDTCNALPSIICLLSIMMMQHHVWTITTCPGPVHLERAVGHENLFPVRWNSQVSSNGSTSHHIQVQETSVGSRLSFVCTSKMNLQFLQTNTNYILITYSSEGQWRFQVEWLCLFSGCLTLCLAEAHRGNLCTLLQCAFGFRFSRKLLKSPKHCEREVFG